MEPKIERRKKKHEEPVRHKTTYIKNDNKKVKRLKRDHI